MHAIIKPISLQLREAELKTYARFCTRPDNHPLYKAKRSVQRHNTSLHLLETASNFKAGDIETIASTRAPPSPATRHTYRIAETKEGSIEWDNENFNRDTMIYTDGSCYKDRVGASAVLYTNGTKTATLKYQLGTAQEHAIFEAELADIILGTYLASQHLDTRTSINFSIDNQATILSMQKNTRQPAQHMVDEIHRCTNGLLQQIDEERPQEITADSNLQRTKKTTTIQTHGYQSHR